MDSDSDRFVDEVFDDDEFGGGDEEMGALAELSLLGHAPTPQIVPTAEGLLAINPDVAEIYSPPRVTKLAYRWNLYAGFALDLTKNDPVDGKPWDFNDPVKRNRAKQKLLQEKPNLLVGCPPCTAFSILFRSNVSRMNPDKVRKLTEEATRHL